MDKPQLRRDLLKARAALDEKTRTQAAQAIKRIFLDSPLLERAQIISAYQPIRGELDCRPLIAALWQKGKQVALPVIENQSLHFCSYKKDDELCPNNFDILEPQTKVRITPDLILLPCLAFDKTGVRLGYGGGHYDRALQDLSAFKVGLAFSAQERPSIPREAHDIALDAVLTETGLQVLTRARD